MLTLKDITLHYGHSQILHGISMEAQKGEVTCVMGTNGVGKTSLIKAISGTHPRSGGSLSLDGESRRFPRRRWPTKGSLMCRRGARSSRC